MKQNIIISGSGLDTFEHALNMLEVSLKELKKNIHYVVPELLVREGLHYALAELCFSFKKDQSTSIIYQFAGSFSRVPIILELVSYKIVRELVQNSIQHAQASRLIVQMIQETERLCFIIEDNGVGFNPQLYYNSVSGGFNEVKCNIMSFKGIVDLRTMANHGTTFTIQFGL